MILISHDSLGRLGRSCEANSRRRPREIEPGSTGHTRSITKAHYLSLSLSLSFSHSLSVLLFFSLSLSVSVSVSLSVSLSLFVDVWVYVCVYVCMYVRMCVFLSRSLDMYVCTCVAASTTCWSEAERMSEVCARQSHRPVRQRLPQRLPQGT